MKTIRTIAMLLVLLMLSACGHEPVIQTEYVFKAIPEALLLPCEGTPPPAKAPYLVASWDEREEMWTETYRRQEVSRKLCNADKKNLRQWNAEQKALYSKNKEAP